MAWALEEAGLSVWREQFHLLQMPSPGAWPPCSVPARMGQLLPEGHVLPEETAEAGVSGQVWRDGPIQWDQSGPVSSKGLSIM